MPRLSIIIPTVRRGNLLLQTLDAATQAIEKTDAEIILVNDNKKESLQLPEKFSIINVLDNPDSGAATARNFGSQHANGDLLLFLDDDILIDASHLEKCFELNEKFPDACFNFNWKFPNEITQLCKQTKFGRFLLHVGLTDYKGWVPELPWKMDELFEVNTLSAFCFIIPKKIFEKSGGFNSSFSRQGVEDDELSKRLVKMGIQLFIEPRVFVLHNEIDKIDLKSRLNRLKAGAYNKRMAFDMGMKEYEIRYSLFKRSCYPILSFSKKIIIGCSKLIPNAKVFDHCYRMMAHILIGTVIFEGYYRKDNHML
jgi:glycosyltransferase involved in cell wall biosynthesis